MNHTICNVLHYTISSILQLSRPVSIRIFLARPYPNTCSLCLSVRIVFKPFYGNYEVSPAEYFNFNYLDINHVVRISGPNKNMRLLSDILFLPSRRKLDVGAWV